MSCEDCDDFFNAITVRIRDDMGLGDASHRLTRIEVELGRHRDAFPKIQSDMEKLVEIVERHEEVISLLKALATKKGETNG